MNSKINELLKDIEKKKKELLKEYKNIMKKYGFTIKKGKIVFSSDIIQLNKLKKQSIIHTLLNFRVREFIGIPFTLLMIIPAVILDLFLLMYQETVFRAYRIPLVHRKNYIVYDKWKLDYLNLIQKFNCSYCSYVNGLFSYAVEIAWRTEKHWCPIKHANKTNGSHQWEKDFADFWDSSGFVDILESRRKK